jgi:hypothetical protein
MRRSPDNCVSRKRFPYFARVAVGSFLKFTEITHWCKNKWGTPNRDHPDAIWACQYEGSGATGELWAWFRHEDDYAIFSLTWCWDD